MKLTDNNDKNTLPGNLLDPVLKQRTTNSATGKSAVGSLSRAKMSVTIITDEGKFRVVKLNSGMIR